MFMPFTAADLDKILAQQQPKEPAEEAVSHPIRVEGTTQALSFSAKRDCLFYLLGILFLVGVGVGAFLVGRCQPQTLQLLQSVLGGYTEVRQTLSFGGIVFASFGALSLLLLVLFLLGFCSIAQPVILLVPLFRGLGYGFAAGTLYWQLGTTSALSRIAILLLPSMLPGALLLMAAGRSAFLFSTRLFRSSVRRENASGIPSIKRYCVRFALFAVICLFIAVLDAAICVKFRGLLL